MQELIPKIHDHDEQHQAWVGVVEVHPNEAFDEVRPKTNHEACRDKPPKIDVRNTRYAHLLTPHGSLSMRVAGEWAEMYR